MLMDKLDNAEEEDLVVLFQDGHEVAFKSLYERIKTELFPYILFLIHDEELAKDYFHDTIIKIFDKLKKYQYNSYGHFMGWCRTIARNTTLEHYRKTNASTFVEIIFDDELVTSMSEFQQSDVFEEIETKKFIQKVVSLTKELPIAQRDILYMRMYKDMSFKEISEELGVNINTCLGRMRYAIINLRKLAKEQDLL